VRVYFDTSAFVKRYVREEGTDTVLKWCDHATEIILSGIALPEIISAFCRLHREAKITEAQYRQLKSALLVDIEDAVICDLAPAVLAPAISSLETNVLRGMDAIHIGSAVALKADVFISSDKRQLDAATRMGLRVGMLECPVGLERGGGGLRYATRPDPDIFSMIKKITLPTQNSNSEFQVGVVFRRGLPLPYKNIIKNGLG